MAKPEPCGWSASVALIPRGRLHVYRGGHLELAADPERLVPAIYRFLR